MAKTARILDDRHLGRGARGHVPLYLQVAAALRHRISAGRWKRNDRMSTLDELEREFGVSRITVRQAVDVLQREGLVSRIQGKGTFIAADPTDRRWLRLDSTWRPLIATIGSNVPHFIETAEQRPPPPLPFEGFRPAARYAYLKSVQTRSRQPFVVAHIHIEQSLFERARGEFLSRVALAVLDLRDDIAVAKARQRFVIGAADVETARLLRVGLGTPTAEASLCVGDPEGSAILVGLVVYRGDCVHIDMDLLT